MSDVPSPHIGGTAPADVAVGGDVVHSVIVTGGYGRGYLTAAQATALPQFRRYLRLLAVIAAPATGLQEGTPPSAPLNVWAVWRGLTGGIQQAADAVTGDIPAWAVVRLAPPTPDQFRAALAAGSAEETAYQVVHCVCHGSPDGLALETDVGRETLMPTDDLVAAFRRSRVRIAFLSACQTLTLAEALHGEAGIPCAVGTTESIYDAESAVLARAFYGALARSATAGEALEEAQAALVDGYVSDDTLRAVAYPYVVASLKQMKSPPPDLAHLYRRFGEERAAILHLVGDPNTRLASPQEQRGAGPLFLAAQPPLPDWDMVSRFVGRGEERVTLATWMRSPRHAVFGLTGEGGIGKTALALIAAAREGYRFGNRVAFVTARDRAEQFSLEDVYSAVAAAYGMGPLPQEPRQRELAVLAALNDPARPCLLVLDNLEDLSQAQAARLAAFLRRINPQSGRSLALVTLRPHEKPPLDELIRATHIRLTDLAPPDALRLAFNEVVEKGVWGQVPERWVGGRERERVEALARFAALERMPVGWLASLLDLAEAAALHPEMIRLGVGKVFGTRDWEDTLFVLRELEPQRDVQEAVGRLAGRMVEDLLDAARTPDERLRREGLRALQALAVFVGGGTRRALQYVVSGEDVPGGALRGLAPEQRRARLAFEDLLDGLVGRNLARRYDGRYDLHPLFRACLRDLYPPTPEDDVAFRLRHARLFLPEAGQYGVDNIAQWAGDTYDLPNAMAAMDWLCGWDGAPVELVSTYGHRLSVVARVRHPKQAVAWLRSTLKADE
nr:CHAT domain-containing protein [Anaerolineae bacterium]